MRDRRDIVLAALEHRTPPYVPWQIGLTEEAAEKLKARYQVEDPDSVLNNHFVMLGTNIETFVDVGSHRYRDPFGVVWDRSIDRDIGVVDGCILPEPTLGRYGFPDPRDVTFAPTGRSDTLGNDDRFRVFAMGFTLFERAWTLRGMENLMMDFVEHPSFVSELLDALTDLNVSVVQRAVELDVDCVHFGDDWGQQRGLLMGPRIWREFIRPRVARLYAAVKRAGKYVSIHSCGDVDELFDDLAEIGLDLFNPFQPEVMDVFALKRKYAGRLAFHGGLSTQRTLPYGRPADVQRETSQLLSCGSVGGYVFGPAHAVEGDVPVENMVAFIETLHSQSGF